VQVRQFLNTTFYRAEVQHVLAEVTEHMAQQHSAHKSLEKLRAENESLALKEKERKVLHYSTLCDITFCVDTTLENRVTTSQTWSQA